ncbi:MAG TPA: hypothetical protein VGK94_02735 [Candidatus Polarisedimenticolia bacterium]
MSEAEERFLETIAGLIPEARGYRAWEGRADTDERLRTHVAMELERLRVKIAELKAAASDEGEEDMLHELDKIDVRMERTIEALQSAAYAGLPFFAKADAAESDLTRICAYDQELLDDLGLLTTDVMGMKYETIGNLTLREAEGTLAAIELKITNRGYIFEKGGED